MGGKINWHGIGKDGKGKTAPIGKDGKTYYGKGKYTTTGKDGKINYHYQPNEVEGKTAPIGKNGKGKTSPIGKDGKTAHNQINATHTEEYCKANKEKLCHDPINNYSFCAPSCPQDPAPHHVAVTIEDCIRESNQLCHNTTTNITFCAPSCPGHVDVTLLTALKTIIRCY